MAVGSKIESRNDRDVLSEAELDGIAAGAAAEDYSRMMQLLSNCLRMMADTQKAIIANIR